MSIFERAAKAKLRFETSKGNLTTEQLFDLSLTQLDLIARSVNKTLKDLGDESFIETTNTPAQTRLRLQLDVLKSVIKSKQEDIAKRESLEEKRTRKARLKEALAAKKDQALLEMSVEDLEKEYASL